MAGVLVGVRFGLLRNYVMCEVARELGRGAAFLLESAEMWVDK